jgi:muramoyltetrapeptide carboxypeptidase
MLLNRTYEVGEVAAGESGTIHYILKVQIVMAEEKKPERIVPPRLKPGDTIGVVAPASPFDREKFDNGIAVLKSFGFRVHIPDNLFDTEKYLAGSDQHRADILNRLFEDKAVNGIICARGGYGSIRILSLIDYNMIKENPKIFCGFSDISAILSALYSRSGLVVFHGPVVTSLGNSTDLTKKGLLTAFTTDEIMNIEAEAGITIQSGAARGPVTGGNLTTLCHLVGTPFEPDFKNHILFLEDRGEAVYRLDRMLAHMHLAGCFEGIAGLIIGSFEDCGPMDDIFELFAAVFDEYRVPILGGFDAGHGKSNVTIPMGVEAELYADRHMLTFHGPATGKAEQD